MTDNDLLALCVLMEAGAEPDDGKAAVARVIRNRMARRSIALSFFLAALLFSPFSG